MPPARRLSLFRHDPERWVGIRNGRFTRPTQLLSMAIAVVLTIAFYLIIMGFFPEPPEPIKDLLVLEGDVQQPGTKGPHSWFMEQGKIPYFIVYFTFWSLAYLVLKWAKLSAQRRALRVTVVPDDPAFVLTPATAESVLHQMYETAEEPRSYLVFNRTWLALSSMRNFGRLGDLEDLLQSQADNDEAVSEASYTIVRGLVWAIPVLGFIGTVIGLSDAIGEFGQVLALDEGSDALKDKLGDVISGLGVAFITTLEALVAALGIHLLLTAIHSQEEQFLDDCREFCQRQLVSRVRITTPDWAVPTTPSP